MRSLRLILTIITISGCFQPMSWTSILKCSIYNIYRIYIIIAVCSFTISQFMNLVVNVSNSDEFTDSLYMMFTEMAAIYKLLIMWINYRNFITLMKYLAEEPFKPLDSDEMEIRQRCDKTVRDNSLRYTTLIMLSCSLMAVASLLTDFRQRKLTYRGWIPYDHSSYPIFCLTYAHQIINTFHCAIINVGCDNLICALAMYVCCQIDILQYRLKKMISTNKNTLGYCIRHHNRILEFAQLMDTRFKEIIGVQFAASTLVICCVLYLLTMSDFNADQIPIILYTVCMLVQIFIYCWFGNKVQMKSLELSDNIFQMDWLMLNDESLKKNLLIIMQRATIPIQFTSAHIITMNLDTFVGLLKLSYSTYSLLAHMQN